MKKFLSLFLAFLMVASCFATIPFSAFAAITSSNSGWNGTSYKMPVGLGTKDDPYLIESAANLLWIQKSIPQGDAVNNAHADVLAGKYRAAFDGVYFKQTADIDLNGKDFKSIGYYYSNSERMAAFGGEYDGQGFKIYNGYIKTVNTSHNWAANYNWGHGLFGMIYGATIKNLTLDNVEVFGCGITGAIVGRAIAPSTNTDPEFNVIENCHVTANVTYTLGFPTNNDAPTAADGTSHDGTDKTPGRLGGIVGMAYGTTVENCSVAATISYYQAYSLVGGIVGTAGFNCVVNNCVFSGRLTMDNREYACDSQESANGGIVGFISPFSSGSVDKSFSGSVKILNCYNSGSFTYLGTGKPAKATYWGGILGGINTLHYVAPTVEDPYPFLIENCYNSYNLTSAGSLNGVTVDQFRIGGLLGSSYCAGNADCGTLWIKDSASVDVDERKYNGTNEYRQHSNVTK